MTDKKNNNADEPEVIIVPPEDQDIMPPEDRDAGSADFIDGTATAVGNGEGGPDGSRAGSRLGLWISVLVVAAFVGGFVAWPKLAPTLDPWLPDSLKPGSGRLAEVTGALDELAVRIATLRENAIDQDAVDDLEKRLKAGLEGLQKQVTEISSRPIFPADLADKVVELGARLDDLETSVQSRADQGGGPSSDNAAAVPGEIQARLKAFGAALAELSGRMSDVEDRAGAPDPAAPAIQNTPHDHEHGHDDLSATVSSLQMLGKDLLARLSAAEARLAAVVDAGSGGSGAALVAAAGQLRSRIESGQGYDIDLDTVQALVGEDADLKAVMAVLQNANTGIPTLVDLRRDFAEIAGDVLAAGQAPAQTWAEKVWRRLSSMVSIRRTGDVAGDDVGALVARAETRLAAGDLAAAVHELKALPEAAATVAAPWLQQAGLRSGVLEALDQLTRQAVQRLAQPVGAAK